MKSLGDEIRRQLGRFGPAAGLGEIVACWPAAVGPEIARNAWPARLARDGTLRVATSSSTWAFELTQLESQILERLRQHVAELAPARLRFAAGPLPEPAVEADTIAARTVPEVDPALRAEAERIAAPIGDPALREAVARAAAASLAAVSRASDDRLV
jgi:hypothetical protein